MISNITTKIVKFEFKFSNLEGSHRGLVRPPAKRIGVEISLVGSNPTPSAKLNELIIV